MTVPVIPEQAGIQATITVWSPLLRLMHWTLAISTILAFASHVGGTALHRWHEIFGYVALATAASRILLGFAANGVLETYWRFSGFVRAPRATWQYLQTVLRRNEPRYLGHNPLGAWMVLALLVNSMLCGISGWLATTDQFWGIAWVQDLHSLTGHAFIPLVVLHLTGVVYSSRRHKESLIGAMLHGKKQV
jgi:cytochrome b